MRIVRRETADDSQLLDIADPAVRQILASRGINSVSDASCELKDLLHFKSLPDIQKAASRIADAVEQDESILVFGDYDVDGMTGAALGVRALRAIGCKNDKVICKVPSRYDGGYGLSVAEVDKAAEQGINLILTVDNGIGCIEAASHAAELDISLVITDHHECPNKLPDAVAVVDPKRSDSEFGSTALCGAGVLFYVLCAVRSELDVRNFYERNGITKPVMADFLDLVTLGTVGDVVAFDPNNRRLVKAGLLRMRSGKTIPGIRALASHTRCSLDEVDPHGIGFELCPRLNAAGRIKLNDNPALELLLTDDPVKADELSSRLDLCNRRRGDFERVFLKEAREDAENTDGKSSGALTLCRKHWLSGISGLIAGKLKTEYGVPCFIFSGENGILKGSARSVPGVPLGKILKRISAEHPGLLLQGGGHAMAAGATIREESLDTFRSVFASLSLEYLQEPCEQELVTDGELDEKNLTLDFARKIEKLGPWGEGFPEPLFDGEFKIISVTPIQNRHLRFTLQSSTGKNIYAIRFRASLREKALIPGIDVKAAYALDVSRYQGTERLQVRLEAVEPL